MSYKPTTNQTGASNGSQRHPGNGAFPAAPIFDHKAVAMGDHQPLSARPEVPTNWPLTIRPGATGSVWDRLSDSPTRYKEMAWTSKTIEAATLDIHEGRARPADPEPTFTRRRRVLLRQHRHNRPGSAIQFSTLPHLQSSICDPRPSSPLATNPTCSQRLTFRACLRFNRGEFHRAGIRSHLRHFAAIRNRHRRV